jgi:hypothetical protein
LQAVSDLQGDNHVFQYVLSWRKVAIRLLIVHDSGQWMFLGHVRRCQGSQARICRTDIGIGCSGRLVRRGAFESCRGVEICPRAREWLYDDRRCSVTRRGKTSRYCAGCVKPCATFTRSVCSVAVAEVVCLRDVPQLLVSSGKSLRLESHRVST